jgi:transcriptional regulator with XRE-family HTH domain
MSGINELAHILHTSRKSKGLTLRELAVRVGITAGYLSALENARNDVFGSPSKKILQKIATELGESDDERDAIETAMTTAIGQIPTSAERELAEMIRAKNIASRAFVIAARSV